MNINDIFTIEQYDEAYQFVSSHEYLSIKDLGAGRYKIVDMTPTQEEVEKEEQERILSLSMTRGDFFDGTIKAFGADDVDLLKPIEALLSSMPEITDIDRKVALNSYKNALNFYRKHPLFDMLSGVDIILSEAQKINITSEQWDKFFDETNKKSVDAYKALLPEESKNENTTGTDTAEPTVNEDELPQESV